MGKTCLSQWFPSRFEVDGVPYPTAEHWMMAEKARLFRDEEVLGRILACEHPGEAKKLGREVRGFDGSVWDAHRVEVVVQGNLHKFAGWLGRLSPSRARRRARAAAATAAARPRPRRRGLARLRPRWARGVRRGRRRGGGGGRRR